MIYNIVLDHIYNTRGHRISQWNNPILDPVSLERYAEAVHDKGAALDNCIGFIDGTVRSIYHPRGITKIRLQRSQASLRTKNFNHSPRLMV